MGEYKFNVGDQGRISKIKRTFIPNFSKEIFTNSKQISRDPPVYKIKDYDDEELKGTFYDKDLQKVTKQDQVLMWKNPQEKRSRKKYPIFRKNG